MAVQHANLLEYMLDADEKFVAIAEVEDTKVNQWRHCCIEEPQS